MISTNQKRKFIRVGTNLVAKVSNNSGNITNDRIVYIRNVSATGAKILSKDKIANIGDILSLQFKYKSVLYNIKCKIVRQELDSYSYGVQFYFNGEDKQHNSTNTINSNKSKLYNDILEEYFNYTSY